MLNTGLSVLEQRQPLYCAAEHCHQASVAAIAAVIATTAVAAVGAAVIAAAHLHQRQHALPHHVLDGPAGRQQHTLGSHHRLLLLHRSNKHNQAVNEAVES